LTALATAARFVAPKGLVRHLCPSLPLLGAGLFCVNPAGQAEQSRRGRVCLSGALLPARARLFCPAAEPPPPPEAPAGLFL